jgi:hypothetical protein
MSTSELKRALARRLRDFAWGQWSQMGVLGSPDRSDHWAADPEALLLLSFEVGREDARLFDEVLDWLALNERFISVQRLRNLALDDEDRALVEAVLGWVARRKRRARLAAKAPPRTSTQPVPFFRGGEVAVIDSDPDFLTQGFLKPNSGARHRAQVPDLRLPINFSFRLRALLGVGARAEVARALVTSSAPRLDIQVIAASTAYAKRNVQEALNSLRASGAVRSTTIGNEQRYEVSSEAWASLLAIDRLPLHVDWPQIFGPLRRILRWLEDPANEQLSEYMRGSESRRLLEELEPDLRYAGIDVDVALPAGANYWDHFVAQVARLPLP